MHYQGTFVNYIFLMIFTKSGFTILSELINQISVAYLCEVKIHQSQGEKLEADWEAIEKPEDEGAERICCDKVFEVKWKEHSPKRGPKQAQKQKDSLVTEPLVPVVKNQPELDVDEHKKQWIKNSIYNGQAQLHIRRDSWRQGRRKGVIFQWVPLRGLHLISGIVRIIY